MLRTSFVLLTALLLATPAAWSATRQCPDTPGSSCKGDSGGWWPDDDDIMRIGAGTGTATVCRHKHAVPYASYCYQLSSTCTPDVPLPMRRHANPNRDGWRSVISKINRGGWCVDACAVVNVPPWAPWTKIPGTDYLVTTLIVNDPLDPLDDEIREQPCWQEERHCTEPTSVFAPCGGGAYCYLPSPQNRTACGAASVRLANPPPPPPPPPVCVNPASCGTATGSCSPGSPSSVTTVGTTQSWTCTTSDPNCTAANCSTSAPCANPAVCGTAAGSCSPGTASSVTTVGTAQSWTCTPSSSACPVLNCSGSTACTTPPACGSGSGTCAPGSAGPVSSTNVGSTITDTWSCSSSNPACSDASCTDTTHCRQWSENDNTVCTCNGTTENCTTTRTCSDGSCPRTGVCPSPFPITTPPTSTPNSPNCPPGPPGPPACGTAPGTCAPGNTSTPVSYTNPCSPYSTGPWGPWSRMCPGDIERQTRTCTDGDAGGPGTTWTCSSSGSTIGCSSSSGSPPSCQWSCSGVPVEDTRTRYCVCPNPLACSTTIACERGQEVVDMNGACFQQSCTVPGVRCPANDCTYGAWSNGAPATVCTTDATSRDVTCTTGADGCGANPVCPTSTTTETESGTKNCTPCLAGNTICNIYLPGFDGADNCAKCCNGSRTITPGPGELPFDMCW